MSDDGRTVCCRARIPVKKGKNPERVIRNGQPVTGPRKHIRELVMSRDGRSIAFLEFDTESRRPVIVRDGTVVSGGARNVGRPVFSPDGRSLAFWVELHDAPGPFRKCMTRDGVPLPGRHYVVCDPVFCPDGRSLAYAAGGGGHYRVFVEGEALPGTSEAAPALAVDREGKRLICIELREGTVYRVEATW
ncbi:MAG: TolB family protein [Candidatus Brocadiia bacterium]